MAIDDAPSGHRKPAQASLWSWIRCRNISSTPGFLRREARNAKKWRWILKTNTQLKAFVIIFLLLALSLMALSLTRGNAESVLHRENLAMASPGLWSFYNNSGGSIVNINKNETTIPSGERLSTLTVSAKFSETNSESYVDAVYRFNSPANLKDIQEIITSLNAGPDISPSARGYFPALNGSYSYGIVMYDIAGNYKGLRHVPITWIGWNEIVIPMSFEPNDASPNWRQNFSVAQVSSIWIYFQSENSFDGGVHSLTFTSLETLRIDYGVTADWIGLGIAYVLFLLLFATPLVIVRSSSIPRPNSRLRSLRSALQPLATKKGAAVYLATIAVKSLLIMVTPLSSDFIDLLYRSTPVIPFTNIFTTSISGGSLWITLDHFLYSSWLVAPVDHPSVREMLPGNVWYPLSFQSGGHAFIFSFLSTPGSLLFMLISKSLLLFFDVAMGFLVYALTLRVSGNGSRSSTAFVLWMVNPLGILAGILWGGVDLIMTFFFMLSVFLLDLRRRMPAAISYGISIGTKLFPAVLFPLMILILRRSLQKESAQVGRNQPFHTRISESIIFLLVAGLMVALIVIPTIVLGGNKSPLPTLGSPGNGDFSFFYGPVFAIPDPRWTLIGLTPVLYALLLFAFFYTDLARDLSSVELMLSGILVLFAFSRINPNFMIWLLPFLVVSIAIRRKTRLFTSFIFLTIGYSLYFFDYYFSAWGHAILFYPATTSELQQIAATLTYLHLSPYVAPFNLGPLMGGLFSGFCVGYLIVMLKEHKSLNPQVP